MKAGKFRDRHQFWIDSDHISCLDDNNNSNDGLVASEEIIIRNGEIIKSACRNFLTRKSFDHFFLLDR